MMAIKKGDRFQDYNGNTFTFVRTSSILRTDYHGNKLPSIKTYIFKNQSGIHRSFRENEVSYLTRM